MDRNRSVGARVDLSSFDDLPTRAVLFGEAQSRVVVSTPDPAALREIALRHGVVTGIIGVVATADDPLEIVAGGQRITASLPWLDQLYYETIPQIMTQSAAAVVSAATESPV